MTIIGRFQLPTRRQTSSADRHEAQAGSSRLISRACVANLTANGLLVDRPRSLRLRRAVVRTVLICGLALMIEPTRTDAVADTMISHQAPHDAPALALLAKAKAVVAAVVSTN